MAKLNKDTTILSKDGLIEKNLNDELSGLASNLAQKANKLETRLKSEKLELEDLSPSTLAAIEGGEGTSFDLLSIPQDRSVTGQKLTDSALLLNKLYEVPYGVEVTNNLKQTLSNATSYFPEQNRIDVSAGGYAIFVFETNIQVNDDVFLIFKCSDTNLASRVNLEEYFDGRYNKMTNPTYIGNGYYVIDGYKIQHESLSNRLFIDLRGYANNVSIRDTYIGIDGFKNTGDPTKVSFSDFVPASGNENLEVKYDNANKKFVVAGSGSISNEPFSFRNFPDMPYKVYRNSKGIYYTDDILSEKMAGITNTFYVDKVNGFDTSNGTSEATAFKTLKKAFSSSQSISTGCVEIVVSGETTFFQDELAGETIVKVPLIIRPKNLTDRIIMHGGIRGVTWTPYENIYKCETPIATNGVINTNDDNIDAYGFYKGIRQVFSLDECKSTENTFYVESDTVVYVHMNGGIKPNENIYPVAKEYKFRVNHALANTDSGVILKNVDMVGVNFFTSARSESYPNPNHTEFIAIDCTVQHGFTGDLIPLNNYDYYYLINCKGGYAKRDIYNYHGTAMSDEQRNNSVICEVNCVAVEGGFYEVSSSGINNLSTCHEGLNIVRFGTSGFNSRGPLIADVNGCRTINIDCNVVNTNNLYVGKNCYEFNNVNAHRQGDVTLIRCEGHDTRNGALLVVSDCQTELVQHSNYKDINISDFWINTEANI